MFSYILNKKYKEKLHKNKGEMGISTSFDSYQGIYSMCIQFIEPNVVRIRVTEM